jgi:hypothetical protein
VSQMRTGNGGERCEYAPPDNAGRKNPPWPETICQPTTDNLERSIPDQKRAEDPA